MKSTLAEFEAIGNFHSEKLAEAGILTMGDLLRYCADRRSRKHYSKKTQIPETLIRGWAKLADLMRISGLSRDYARLLKAAQIGTIEELRKQKPEQLRAHLANVNSLRRLSADIPSHTQVREWVAHASAIEPFVTD